MNRACRAATWCAAFGLVVACERESAPSIAGVISASNSATLSAWSEPVSLGSTINSAFNDQQAALTKDGLTLYFASNRPGTPGPGPNDIWVAHRDCLECPFGEPANLGAPVNTADNDAAPVLSRDEHWLFFLSTRTGIGSVGSSDLWVAYRQDVHDDSGWQEPVNLGPGVNTSGFEGGPAYFANEDGSGAQLFFNHNPQPVAGGGDILVSTQAPDGSWGAAVPVTELNSTTATDQRPAISHDGLEIVFFSNRDGSVGGSVDIWQSSRPSVDAPWTTPTNVGAPVNTAAAEQHPFMFKKGRIEQLYFARNMGTGTVQNLDLLVSTRLRDN